MLSKVRVSKKNESYYPAMDVQRNWLWQIQKAFDMPFDVVAAMRSYENQSIKDLIQVIESLLINSK